jgi:hypothetical protein
MVKLLDGQDTECMHVLPTQVVYRQSCGCAG